MGLVCQRFFLALSLFALQNRRDAGYTLLCLTSLTTGQGRQVPPTFPTTPKAWQSCPMGLTEAGPAAFAWAPFAKQPPKLSALLLAPARAGGREAGEREGEIPGGLREAGKPS